MMGLLILGSVAGFFACNQKSASVSTVVSNPKATAIIAADTKVDAAVVTAGSEADVFSLGSASIATFSTSIGLKSTTNGGGKFRTMYDKFPRFKLHYRYGVCPDLSLVTTNGGYPKTMTIDYGDSLQMANGHILKGKIIIVLSAAPFTSESTQSITFDNFCIDSVCVSGTSVKTRTKDPEVKFTEAANLTITMADGTIVHRDENNERTFTTGTETEFDPSDDVTVTTTGQVVITDSKGNSYSKVITFPLVKMGECKFISKGVIEYKNNSGIFATLDYGDGTCDNHATKTTPDSTAVITLGHMGR